MRLSWCITKCLFVCVCVYLNDLVRVCRQRCSASWIFVVKFLLWFIYSHFSFLDLFFVDFQFDLLLHLFLLFDIFNFFLPHFLTFLFLFSSKSFFSIFSLATSIRVLLYFKTPDAHCVSHVSRLSVSLLVCLSIFLLAWPDDCSDKPLCFFFAFSHFFYFGCRSRCQTRWLNVWICVCAYVCVIDIADSSLFL